MCNACGFFCCASDSFDGCGCDCPEADCRMERCPSCQERYDPHIGEICRCEEWELYGDDPEDGKR